MTRFECGAIVAILSAPAVWAAPAAAVPADFAAQADAVLADSYRGDAPGVAVVVMQNGKIVYDGGRGLADVEAKRALTADTVFRIGSITKQFTAAVVLQLVEEGGLSLDDPLSMFLPDYPKPGAEATIAQLLNHTSGIKSYTGIPGAMTPDNTSKPLTTGELIARFKDHAPDFERGTRFLYNNSGYVLLGAVIEKVTGKPWYVVVEERISRPLGLSTIRYGGVEREVPAMARGYTLEAKDLTAAQAIDMSVPHAAGALIGSPRDLATWAHALHHGKVLKSETYARMIAPTTLADGSTERYGYGLTNAEIRGRKAIGHGGGIFGFSTSSFYVPEADLFVAVFANSDDPQTSPDLVTLRLAALALGDPYPTFTKANVPMASIEPLLGKYRIDENVERIFFARDGKLYTRRSGGSDSEVLPAGNDRFFYPGSLNWFEMVRDSSGKHVMNMHQMGENKAEPAIWTGPVPEEEPEFAVAPEVLRSYAGDYTSPIAPIKVRLGEDGRLTLQFGDQKPAELIALSETEFRPVGVDARILFEAKGGQAQSLRLRQGGRELPAARDPWSQ